MVIRKPKKSNGITNIKMPHIKAPHIGPRPRSRKPISGSIRAKKLIIPK